MVKEKEWMVAYNVIVPIEKVTDELRIIQRYCKDLVCEVNEKQKKFPFKKFLDGYFDRMYNLSVSYSGGVLRLDFYRKKTNVKCNRMVITRKDDASLLLSCLDDEVEINKQNFIKRLRHE